MPAKTLNFQSPRHLSQLYAGKAENLAHAERALGVKLVTREDWLKMEAYDRYKNPMAGSMPGPAR